MQALACSLNASNPGLPLIVLTAEGDLQPNTLATVQQFAQLRVVSDFSIPNLNLPRYSVMLLLLLLLLLLSCMFRV